MGFGVWFNAWIENIGVQTGLSGASLLIVTIPLAIVQGFLGLFPFATLIFVHVSAMGVTGGLIASWLAGTLAAIVVYAVCKFLFRDWFNRKWGHKLDRYGRWQKSFDRYGIWTIILLRTLPIMPNNLISFMAAISPIRTSAYVWSSIIGNLSHIWLFGIISASFLFPGTDIWLLIGSYVVFCAVLTALFIIRIREDRLKNEDKGRSAPL